MKNWKLALIVLAGVISLGVLGIFGVQKLAK